MAEIVIRFVDFMDARPLAGVTLEVSLTIAPRFPTRQPDGSIGPPLTADSRFAQVLTRSAVTDAGGRAQVNFDDEEVFARLSRQEREQFPRNAVDAIGTFRSGASFSGIRFGPRVLATGLRAGARLERPLAADLGMSIVGHTTPHTTRLWFHLPFTPSPEQTFTCNVATVPVATPSVAPGPLEAVLPGRAFPVRFEREASTAVIDVAELPAGATHEYTLLVERGPRKFVLVTGRFRTPAEAHPDLTFAFGSCHLPVTTGTPEEPSQEARRTLELWQRLADRKNFEALLLIGDQIYGDEIEKKWPDDDDFHRYLRRYRQLWAYRPMREVLRSIPTYMILDDHEVADDYGVGELRKEKVEGALRAYRLFQHKHNPGPLEEGENTGPLHYNFRWGPAAFFVMDGRTRRKQGSPVFGARQLEDLRRWANSRQTRAADLIFFVAPIPLALLPTEIVRKVADKLTEQTAVTAGFLVGLALGGPASGAVLGATGFAAAEIGEDFVEHSLLMEFDLGERWDNRENQPDLIRLLDLLFDLANGVGDDPPRKRAVFILSGDIHAGTMHAIRSLPKGNGERHVANPLIIQATSSALSHEEPVSSTLWAEAVAKIDEKLDVGLLDIDLSTLASDVVDWSKFSLDLDHLPKELLDDVFVGRGEYFLDPNHDERFLTQYAGLLMERTLGHVRVERRDPRRRAYRIRFAIEGQSSRRLESDLDVDLDAPSPSGVKVTPDSINFGSVQLESVQTRSLTIQNVSGASVDVSIPAPAGGHFSWQAFQGSLASGGTLRVPIEFRPTSSNIERGSLTVTSTAGDSHSIPLVGKGPGGFKFPPDPEPEPEPPRELKFSPRSINFGIVPRGTVGRRTLTIKNATGARVDLSIPASQAPFFTWQPFQGSLANGQELQVVVELHSASSALARGSLVVTSTAPGSPHSIGLLGKGPGGFPFPPPE